MGVIDQGADIHSTIVARVLPASAKWPTKLHVWQQAFGRASAYRALESV